MAGDDLFHDIRKAVSKTLEMAEAASKISDETKKILSQLILTRRGDGEIVLDVGALQRMKASANQWIDKDRSEQDRLVNPTRLPQLLPGLSGLSAAQYLGFVQRPLERDGENARFLEETARRLSSQYGDRELSKERTKLFGPMQQHLARTLLDEAMAAAFHGEATQKKDTLSAPQQFDIAAQQLGLENTEMMSRLFDLSVALTLTDRIKAKAQKVKGAKEPFEKVLRRLAATDCGPTAKTRLKEIFLVFQKDLTLLDKEAQGLDDASFPLLLSMKKDNFESAFANLHISAARLDAIASRWVIIIAQANNPDKLLTDVDRIKGMHKVVSS